jgi:hypothetical protein
MAKAIILVCALVAVFVSARHMPISLTERAKFKEFSSDKPMASLPTTLLWNDVNGVDYLTVSKN